MMGILAPAKMPEGRSLMSLALASMSGPTGNALVWKQRKRQIHVFEVTPSI